MFGSDQNNAKSVGDSDGKINAGFSRRTLLKRTGQIGALGLLPTGSTLASESPISDSDVRPDTSFDPRRQQEVASFVANAFEVREQLVRRFESQPGVASATAARRADEVIDEERDRLLNELSARQREAVGNVLADSELVLDHRRVERPAAVVGSDDTVGTTGHGEWEFESFTGKLEARLSTVVGTFDAFTYWHNVEWEANHDWPPEMRGIDPSAWGDGKNHLLAYWDYTGSSRDDIDVYSNYFLSEKTGTFNGCLLIGSSFTCPRDDQAYIEIAGSSNGSGSVTEKSVNGTA